MTLCRVLTITECRKRHVQYYSRHGCRGVRNGWCGRFRFGGTARDVRHRQRGPRAARDATGAVAGAHCVLRRQRHLRPRAHHLDYAACRRRHRARHDDRASGAGARSRAAGRARCLGPQQARAGPDPAGPRERHACGRCLFGNLLPGRGRCTRRIRGDHQLVARPHVPPPLSADRARREPDPVPRPARQHRGRRAVAHVSRTVAGAIGESRAGRTRQPIHDHAAAGANKATSCCPRSSPAGIR